MAVMSAAYLAGLDRAELDTWMLEAEHATRKAHLVVAHCPLTRESLADACGVAQDCSAWLTDCYDASMVLWAAEFDRIFGLGGDQ
jgi:hypothetical protein